MGNEFKETGYQITFEITIIQYSEIDERLSDHMIMMRSMKMFQEKII